VGHGEFLGPGYAGFYDKTRNLSGQFCGPACNSQVAMRAYRERRKSA
jgi:hypothetical protein